MLYKTYIRDKSFTKSTLCFHVFISELNICKDSEFLISSGTDCQISGALKLIVSVPLFVLLTLFLFSALASLKEYGTYLVLKFDCMKFGLRLF